MVNFSWVSAQTWTSAQLEKANTAKDIALLTPDEKEAILYINLCRLYPQDFLKKNHHELSQMRQYHDWLIYAFARQNHVALCSLAVQKS